ncbi:hypothetical protein L0657_15975 [Dyadobacter sp. CY345]|uniref:hypothetical protein n=1 Tax=Dyadobacter sp. CY345 TaxID=2909335 RepID=UPI001F1F8AC8|nr:hypothetical protein [Dyadobacter sp. CY345]MCF2445461.1 hypothetical protein [Dyadobacter sp. CY345]
MCSGSKISDYCLFLVWLLHSSIILLLAYVNPNHYTTIDSHYYLESADNLLSGNGYYIFENNFYNWNSTFPPGYSLAISITSLLTTANDLIASKLVNIAASGVWLIYLNRWLGKEKAIILSCILFLGSFLKLWAHTWSEPLFLIVLFCWTYQFFKLNNDLQISRKTFSYLFLLGLLLMLIRYAGIFIIPLALACCLYHIRKKNNKKAKAYAWLLTGWATLFIFYLSINKYQSGEIFGGKRFYGNISISENLTAFSKGILNELLIRDVNFELFNISSMIGTGIQTVVMLLLFIQNNQRINKPSSLTIHFFVVAIGYNIFLFSVRIFSPFDEPGYRLLAPFSFLALCGFCLALDLKQFSTQLKCALLTLILFSWLDLIPRYVFGIKLLKVLTTL